MLFGRRFLKQKTQLNIFQLFYIEKEEDDGPVDDPLPENMKVWKCLYTDKTMFGDGYKFRRVYEDTVMEVKGKLITKSDLFFKK